MTGQIIRIYRKSGGLAYSFRPFGKSPEYLERMQYEFPEGGFHWLR